MKYFVIVFMKGVLRCIYAPMKMMIKTKRKIVYLSRQSNEKSLDMEMLSKEIQRCHPECQQVFGLRRLEKNLLSMFRFAFGILVDMYHMAGASVVICDTYSIPVSCLKHKPSLTTFQIWHAMGAVKKFGLQSVGLEEGRNEQISKAMQMHENYDYVIAPSEATASFYEEAFGTKREKMVIASLPRIDYLLDGKTRVQEFLEKNPEKRGKEIVLYLPTFRNGEDVVVESLQRCFEQDKERELIVSLHPFSKVLQKDKYLLNGDFNTFDLMKIADHIITDYSACAFEASLLNVPVWFYVPDYEQYDKNRGLNIDLKKELKTCVFEDAKQLYEHMSEGRYDFDALKRFQEKYIWEKDNCTQKLADIIGKAI